MLFFSECLQSSQRDSCPEAIHENVCTVRPLLTVVHINYSLNILELLKIFGLSGLTEKKKAAEDYLCINLNVTVLIGV